MGLEKGPPGFFPGSDPSGVSEAVAPLLGRPVHVEGGAPSGAEDDVGLASVLTLCFLG